MSSILERNNPPKEGLNSNLGSRYIINPVKCHPVNQIENHMIGRYRVLYVYIYTYIAVAGPKSTSFFVATCRVKVKRTTSRLLKPTYALGPFWRPCGQVAAAWWAAVDAKVPNGPRRKIPRSRHLDLDGLGRFSPACFCGRFGWEGNKSSYVLVSMCSCIYRCIGDVWNIFSVKRFKALPTKSPTPQADYECGHLVGGWNGRVWCNVAILIRFAQSRVVFQQMSRRWSVTVLRMFTENSVFFWGDLHFWNVLYKPLATVSGAARIHDIFQPNSHKWNGCPWPLHGYSGKKPSQWWISNSKTSTSDQSNRVAKLHWRSMDIFFNTPKVPLNGGRYGSCRPIQIAQHEATR